jgi:hypothetical protein
MSLLYSHLAWWEILKLWMCLHSYTYIYIYIYCVHSTFYKTTVFVLKNTKMSTVGIFEAFVLYEGKTCDRTIHVTLYFRSVSGQKQPYSKMYFYGTRLKKSHSSDPLLNTYPKIFQIWVRTSKVSTLSLFKAVSFIFGFLNDVVSKLQRFHSVNIIFSMNTVSQFKEL